KVEGLFDQFEKAHAESRKEALVQQICAELSVHTVIEEEIFYPACREKIEDDLLDESFVEHDGAKVLIAERMAGKPSDPFYHAKVSVLSEMMRHHVQEEERRGEGVFAQARAAGLDMDELGRRLSARKAELLEDFKEHGLPAPRTRSFPGHHLTQGKPLSA